MQTINVVLAESGRIFNLKKDFPLYVGSYQNKLLSVLVPKSVLGDGVYTHYIDSDGVVKAKNGVYTAVKVGMTYLQRDGVLKESKTYYLRYLKDVVENGIEYSLYERPLPKAFTLFEGQGENAPRLVVNVVNIIVENEEPKTLDTITSQYAGVDVMYSAELVESGEDPTDLDIINSQINSLNQQIAGKSEREFTVGKVDLYDDLPLGISFDTVGYKTLGVLFCNFETKIQTILNAEPETVIGSLLVVDRRVVDNFIEQTEVLFYNKGVATRTVKLNLSLEPYSTYGWETKISKNQRVEDAGKFLYINEYGKVDLKSSIKELIVQNNGKPITDNATILDFSVDFDLKQNQYNADRVSIELAKTIKDKISSLETGNNAAYFIDATVDENTYLMSILLKNKQGVLISQTSIDLPLETMVVNASYENGSINFTLKNGTVLEVEIGSLINGLVSNTTTINGYSLKSNIELNAEDVGTYTKEQIDEIANEKVDRENGKGLSSNDFTDDYKTNIETAVSTSNNALRIANNAVTKVEEAKSEIYNTQTIALKASTDATLAQNSANEALSKLPTKTSQLQNDSGFITANDVPTTTVKLYSSTGNNTDGAMTQKAATDKFNSLSLAAYGTCPTAAGTAGKIVTLANENWTLNIGSIIGVKFSNTNTASNCTLNVNNTGAKSIYYNNAVYTSNGSNICGYANRVVYYMYDGTYWVWLSIGVELSDDNVIIAGDLSVNGQIKFPNDVPTDNTSSWIYVCKGNSAKNGFGATSLTSLGSRINASKDGDGNVIKDTYVKKVSGKDLSSNDFTDALLTKLNGIAEGANKTVVDTILNISSTNPVQNKAAATAIFERLKRPTQIWENPNPTASFTPQTIILNSSDYNLLLVVFKYDTSTSETGTMLVDRGNSFRLAGANGANTKVGSRKFFYTDTTHYSVDDGYWNGSKSNADIIPFKIYGL